MEHRLCTSLLVSRPLDEVFDFFARAENLERITPPWLSFRILSELPIAMGTGATIRYRLKLRGLPIRWLTGISTWEPPYRFVDRQLKGPYRQWIHEHRFRAEGSGTRIDDEVRYIVPGGILEPWIHKRFVRPELERIFAYREDAVRRELDAAGGLPESGAA